MTKISDKISATYKALREVLLLPFAIFECFDCNELMMNRYYSGYSDDSYFCTGKEYSEVLLEDLASDDLLGNESVTTHDEIYPKKSIFGSYTPSNNSGYSVQSNDHLGSLTSDKTEGYSRFSLANGVASKAIKLVCFATTNPADGSVIVCNEAFKINFGFKQLHGDRGGWEVFSADGLMVHLYDDKLGIKEDHDFSIRKFTIQLKQNAAFGHLQFIQTNRHGMFIANKNYPYRSIINIYVYRRPVPIPYDNVFPYIYTLIPKGDITFMPMMDRQKLQIITPCNVGLQYKEKQDGFTYITSNLDKTENYKCTYYNYEESLNKDIAAIVTQQLDSPSESQRVIVIPKIELNTHKERYAVVNAVFEEFTVCCNSIDGIIFRDCQSRSFKPRTFLDNQMNLKVESFVNLTGIDGKTAFELKVRIVNRAKKTLTIKNLFGENGCDIT